MVTTIQLDEKIKEKLDKLKIHHRESYNELIKRLIENCSPNKASRESLIATIEIMSEPDTIRDIADALEAYERGEWVSYEDVKKKLKLD